MFGLIHLFLALIFGRLKSRRRLEIENLYLRHQLNIAMRRSRQIRLHGTDRLLLVWMTRFWPDLLGVSRIVRPDTILRWHRAGFRAYWRWKSGGQPGPPKISGELRELIRQMSRENRLWGAPRIHGELLKLGFEVAESTVAKYMIRHRRRKHGERSCAIRLMRSQQSIYASSRRPHSSACLHSLLSVMGAESCFGSP
jgi:hypothetical protein